MTILKRELARSARGQVMNDEDWWFLAKDTDTGDVFVIHGWAHTDVRKPTGNSDVGSTHIELSVFLAEQRQNAAQQELRNLIRPLIDGNPDAARALEA